MAKNQGPQLIEFDNPQFDQIDDAREMLQMSLGEGGRLGINDLDRVKIPNGTPVFMVPSLEGEDSLRELEGVVIFARSSRSFWRTPVGSGDASDSPPDCYSDDGVQGHGDPGVACADCKFAEFGSMRLIRGDNSDSQAQACKQTQILFMLTEDGLLPKVLRLPPTSLRNWRQYTLRLMSRGVKLHDVVTKFTCKLQKNAGNLSYVQVEMAHGGQLGPKTKAALGEMANILVPKLNAPRALPDDIVIENADDTRDEGGEEVTSPPSSRMVSDDPDADALDAI